MPNSYNPGSGFTQTSGYGSRILNGKPDWHPGVDFAAAAGTSIHAASGGTVVYSGFNSAGYGNVVIIKAVGLDGNSYYTLYQ
jgi:murein DD-endopeptidase MepM/ murein hydrolase activator NlpD